jgi:glutamate-1-semialdehyde 2,1-aminomutase
MVAPSGPVYQAGTLSGNPVAMAAGLATLDQVTVPGFYETLAETTRMLTEGLQEQADFFGVPFTTTRVGGMFGLFFCNARKIVNFEQSGAVDVDMFKRFFHAMLDGGVYLAPSAYEAGFVSSAHTEEHISATIDAGREAFRTCVS